MIRDFISSHVSSGIFFEGTYGIEIETESLDKYSKPRLSIHHETGEQIIGKNGLPISDMKFWDLKKDGSLRNYGVEYVLKVPLMYDDELLQALAEFEDKTQKIEFIQDSISTSVHIHVNVLPETWKTVANFLTIYTLIENILIEYSGSYRRNNLFCLPIRSVPSVVDLIQVMFGNVSQKYYSFNHKLSPDAIKYAALNLSCLFRFGSIEFRSFRGVTDVEIIYKWVSVFQKILEYSRMDWTPSKIMDNYKVMGSKLFEEIFQEYWELLKHEKEEELLKPNLWYAGNIAYSLSEEAWNTLDILPEKVQPKKLSLSKKKSSHLDEMLHNYLGGPGYFTPIPVTEEAIIPPIPFPDTPQPNVTWDHDDYEHEEEDIL